MNLKGRIHYFWLTKIKRQQVPTPDQIDDVLWNDLRYGRRGYGNTCQDVAEEYVQIGSLKHTAEFFNKTTERIRQILWKVWRSQYTVDKGYR